MIANALTAKTLIIVNPYAASGAALRVWHAIEALLRHTFGELVVAITDHADEVPEHLVKAIEAEAGRVLAIGGDGTNHALINALVRHHGLYPDAPLIYGSIPAGTGQDFARAQGLPRNAELAVPWLAGRSARWVDVGNVTIDGVERHFLNISSVGLSADVAERVETSAKRRAWTFFTSIVGTIMHFSPVPMQITLDGTPWYTGTSWLAAIANSTTFARGLRIAPLAEIDDGVFDVVLVEGMSRRKLLAALWQGYAGTHLSHPQVRFARASHVRIQRGDGLLGLDMDGEPARGQELIYTMKPRALQMLL
jgi:diacylglycerol kinase (ATP)